MLSEYEKKTVRGVATGTARVASLLCLFAMGYYLWQGYVAPTRTATVREVFLYPANRNLGPQIYMDDGTVWALNDTAGNVRAIRGDEVRYMFVSNPSETMDSPSPDSCKLEDVTTGYSTQAVRLSAPFKHSSCPAN
jgi:hypothetical protein